MHPSVRLVRSDRPEGRVLSCLNPPSTQTVSLLYVRRTSISVQSPPLRAIPVASCLHQGRGGSPCSIKGSRHSHSQLPRQLAHTGPVSSTVVRTQGHGAWPPQPVGASGQLGKEQTLPCAEDLAFLRAGVPLGQVSRHVVVSTDASAMGWGAMCNGHAAAGIWTGSRLQWHINCLELLAVWLALRHFKGLLHDKHVLVRTDNTATVAYINHQGGLRSRRLSQLARHLLLWSQKHLRSLRAVHIPGELNRAANELSRQSALPGEWRLHPEVVQLIWRRFGDAQVDLFASPDTFHCQLFLPPCPRDPRHGRAGTQLASGPTQICVSPGEPSRTDPVQGQGGRGAGPLGGAVLAQSDLVPRTDAPRDSPSLANSSEEGSPFSERGHPLAPASRLVESPRMVLGRDAEVLDGLPPSVVNTITSARAPSTRHAYRLKWNLFVDWCSSRREDPRRCPIAVVLSFLQDGLERRLSPSTLKVYVAAIAAHHDAVDGKSVGKHDLVIRFLRGARRLNPPRPHLVPSWDLPRSWRPWRRSPSSLCSQ